MKIIALLSWFDEDPKHLWDLLHSLAITDEVDHLVAVDGAYELWPSGPRFASLREEHDVFRNMTGTTLHIPDNKWASEIEKRNFLFKLGHAIAEPGEDWLWVIDGDEVVTEAHGLREQLERTEMDVLTVTEYGDGNTRNERRLFRAHPKGIHLEGTHSRYRNGDGDLLWDGQRWGPDLVWSERTNVQVLHRPHERSEERNQARNAYYEAVKEHKAELLI